MEGAGALMKLVAGQAFQTASSRRFPVPHFDLVTEADGNWQLESR
jgi:hypothetical protein